MDKLALALKAWQEHGMDLDDTLETLDISHADFRQFLDEDQLYDMTPGMKQEIRLETLSGRSLRSCCKKFRTSMDKATYAAYSDTVAIREDKAALIEADISLGLSQETIAEKYGISQGRVSQIAAQLRPPRKIRKRKPLTQEEEAEIKKLDRDTAMKQYSISRTTYYKVVKR